MRIPNRIRRLEKLRAVQHNETLTVLLVEAAPRLSPGRREKRNAAGLRVLEISFDPATGWPELPRGPFKLIRGADPLDLV